MITWMLILNVAYGPIVVPNIATYNECDRLGRVIFKLHTEQENEKAGFWNTGSPSFSCRPYLSK